MTKVKNKNKSTAQAKTMEPAFEPDCDDFLSGFSKSESSCSSLEIPGVMHTLIDASNFHGSLAFEITKLIVDHAPAEKKTEESILNSFALASKMIRENSPLHSMMGRLSE